MNPCPAIRLFGFGVPCSTFGGGHFFTVMSLDLQPDVNLDGGVGETDAPALAADWDRKWLVPAGTNAWFPVKVFKDVALPGTYTLALSGPSNVCARYGDVTVRGGGAATVPFPSAASQETVEVQADGPGEATLAVSFAGSGAATNYNAAASVDIKAWGVDIVPKGDYSDIHPFSRPVFDCTAGKKWVAATFPEPQQVNVAWDVKLLGRDSGTVRFKYQRGTGPEAEIPWNGGAHDLNFADGWLDVSIRLNDGPGATPTMTFSSDIVTVSGVQQGDRIIVEEAEFGCRDEIAVVKNFSWNDLQRLGVGNLRMHPDFDGLLPGIKAAIIETVVFCLDASPSRPQKLQLTNDVFQSTGLLTVNHSDFHATHPDLLRWNIPSARSIGLSPWDCEHFHLGVEASSIPPLLAEKRTILLDARDAAFDNGYAAFKSATTDLLVDLMNSTHSDPIHMSFPVFHTYEYTPTFKLGYLSPEVTSFLLPGDPIRNIRWSFIMDASPLLTYPGQDNNAEWKNGDDPPVELCEIQFFVTRKDEIVLLGTDGHNLVPKGLVSDALRED